MRRSLLLLLALAPMLRASEEAESQLRGQLAVQAAIREAEEHLRRGSHKAAVAVLEKHIAYIDGNRHYLGLLRDAYQGHLEDLRKAGSESQASVVQERLNILQPAAAPRAPRSAPAPTPAPAVAVIPRSPKLEVRGKIEEKAFPDIDPFSDANQAPPVGVAALVSQAEKAFAARDYLAAGRLYEDAEASQPGCAAACKERWAYCKLARVAEVINGDGIPAGDELEREIDDALKMTTNPKLEAFAGQLRARLRDVASAIPVRHTPREGQGWALVETANFRVFHATTEEKAARAARLAEAARTALARKWLGEVPANWSPRCDIYLHPTVNGYTRDTKAPAALPGHSRIGLKDGKVVSRRIDLRMDDPNLWLSTLPHEATHVILAGHFGLHHLPRWADEGIAVLSESRERPRMHTQILPNARREGQLFRLETLIKLDDYPDARRVPIFYAQSVALVEFLVKRGGPVVLTRFIRDGLDSGHESALKKHYGYSSFAELEQEWLQDTFSASVAKANVTRKAPR
jgi:hypothetical protein